MKLNQEEILLSAKARLSVLNGMLEEVEFKEFLDLELTSSQFRNLESTNLLLKKIDRLTPPIIYFIQCRNVNERNDLIQAFREFQSESKKENRQISLSKFNINDSETIYVGCTMNNFKKRMFEHLGHGNLKTYSLHLSRWDVNIDYTIFLKAFQILLPDGKEFGREFLELVEQSCWDKFRPVFGKKSGL